MEFLKSATRRENDSRDVMELYNVGSILNKDELISFLKEHMSSEEILRRMSEETVMSPDRKFLTNPRVLWYYIVFFDSKENAVFPQTPFTARYVDEEEPQKHIKAMYEYNRLNGYSVLSLYEKNKWESPAEEIRIPI